MSQAGFLPEFFQGGESIVTQISIVMKIFLLFSDNFFLGGGAKSLGEGQTALVPVKESQQDVTSTLLVTSGTCLICCNYKKA